MATLSEEDIATSLKNVKTTDEIGASDTESDSEDNGDDCLEVVARKFSKVLENINEVMTWLEQNVLRRIILNNMYEYTRLHCAGYSTINFRGHHQIACFKATEVHHSPLTARL
jgi:hypothetical protein